ncbi:hypothetical protein F5Y17DRAFT_426870 [Xylariaceae sp. FL0594]|nr:hypothetical protein F5Y17DRAFT_426870 [Xylariaceae sp. FL0594]
MSLRSVLCASLKYLVMGLLLLAISSCVVASSYFKVLLSNSSNINMTRTAYLPIYYPQPLDVMLPSRAHNSRCLSTL